MKYVVCTSGGWCDHEQIDEDSSFTVTTDGNIGRVTSELLYILLDPCQSCDDVVKGQVAAWWTVDRRKEACYNYNNILH